MSEALHPSVLDFHSPRRPTTEAFRQLLAWQSAVCTHVQEGWAALLARPVTLQAGKIEPVQYHTALHRLPEDGLGIYFSVSDLLLPAMIVFSGRQVQGLVADLLDLPGDTWPEVKKLTSVEDAMLELLLQKLAEGIGEGWPASTSLKCRYLETTSKPQRTRLFPMGSALFCLRFKIQSRFGEDVCYWLMLKEETERLILDQLGEGAPEETNGPHPDLLALAERVPLDIVVQLGKAELTMSQIAALSVGDVLVLDQLVSRPLVAAIEGTPKWAGVPKRIGSRQALEVTHVVEGDSVAAIAAQSPPATSQKIVAGPAGRRA